MNLLSVRMKSSTKAFVHTFSDSEVSRWTKLKLTGVHNYENAAAALRAAQIFGVGKPQGLKVVSKFTGIPFRLETVATINGIKFVNDTTSTSPIATIKALQAVKSPLILLLGGQSKNLPVDELASIINKHQVNTILLSGSGTDEIKPLLKKQLILKEFSDQDKAVKYAFQKSKPATSILFSPGFTSFDSYPNEFERGKDFNRSVKNVSIKN